jgi:hypothetical protein
VGLNNLAVTKGAYTSLRTMFRDATSLSTSYDKFLQPAYSRDVPRSNAQTLLKTLSTPVTRKPTDGPCRLCAELGKSVVWTREHWNKEHPQFSKSLVPRKRTLNNIEEVQQEADSELREGFWEMFSVEEEEENRQVSNYSPLPHTPVTINGNLHTALVDSGANPSYIQEELVNKLGLTISPHTAKTSISREGKVEPSKGTVVIDCGNGDNMFRNLRFTVIDIPYDLIIGRNYFSLFGFVLSGLPVKLPGPQVTITDQLVPPIDPEEILPPPVTDPR